MLEWRPAFEGLGPARHRPLRSRRSSGESKRHVAEALSLQGCFVSDLAGHARGSGRGTLGDLVPESGPSDQEAAEARVMIGTALRVLGERDRYVLRLRYFEGLTQQEIGDELG